MKKPSNPGTSVQVLTGLTMLVGLSEGAQALPLEESKIFDVGASSSSPTGDNSSGSATFAGNELITFDLFNTLGGTRTLTDVNFNWQNTEGAYIQASAMVSAPEASEGAEITAAVSADFSFNLLLNNTVFFSAPLSNNSEPCSAGSGSSCTTTASASGFAAGMFEPMNLAIFQQNSPGTFAIDVIIANGEGQYSTSGAVEGASWNGNPSGTWTGQFDVQYIYEEVTSPVPEPASLLLFGAGLAGLTAVRKRRKNLDS